MAERAALCATHYEDILSHYGHDVGLRIGRKHLAWYATGLPSANRFRNAINQCADAAMVRASMRDFFAGACDAAAA